MNDCIEGARMSLTGSIIDIDFHRQFYQLANMLDEVFEKESRYNLFQIISFDYLQRTSRILEKSLLLSLKNLMVK